MRSPRHPTLSRLRALGGAALIFALLVLPPAISAGQDPVEGGEPVAGESELPSGGTGQDGQLGPGAGSGGGTAGGSEAGTDGGAATDQGAPVQPASTEATPVARKSTPAARFAASTTVSIGDNFYSPASVTINVGDTVTWTNNGQAEHSATASDGSFDTGVFGPGGSRSHTFTQSGTFDYFCTVHGASQSGTVNVSGGGGGAGGGGGSGGGQSEADAVASAGAAGDGNTLPLTGEDVLPPLGVGLLLLFAGLALRLRDWARPV